MEKTYEVTVQKTKRHNRAGGVVWKWVGLVNGRQSSEALTRRDALKWAQEQADYLRRQAA